MTRISPLILLLALVAALSCGGDDSDEPEPEEAESEETPQEFLASSADALEEASSFHFLLTHENGATAIVLDLDMRRAEGDIITPDRLKAQVEADGPGGIDVEVEIIAIGEDFWFENPFGGGFIDADFSIQDILDPTQGAIALLRSAPENAEFGDNEEVAGVDTRVVTATVDSGEFDTLIPAADPGLPVEVTVWIGAEDRLPYRIQMVGPLNEDEPDDIERLIEISNYNSADVEIEPPE